MAATLRRALESAATGEDHRLRELVREIQQRAIICRISPPEEDGFFELGGPPDVFTSFSRSFWQVDVTGSVLEGFAFAEGTLDWDIVHRFRSLADLNVARLRQQVLACLVAADSVLLSDVLRRFPPQEGILEVIGYLVIATQDSNHYVARDQFSTIQVSEEGVGRVWRVPEVLFTRAE